MGEVLALAGYQAVDAADESEAPRFSLPEGFEDKDAFLKAAVERFELAQDVDRENREAAQEDLEFFAGQIWDPVEEQTRIDEGKPCLNINRMPQFVAQIVGDIRINRPAIRVRPAEDADKDLAETREGLLRQIERDSRAQQVYANAGQSQVACGIGNFRVVLDYAADDSFNQDIIIRAIPDPFAVVWDPLAVDPTGRDASYCFVVDEMPKKEAEERWPDACFDFTVKTPGYSEGWIDTDTVKVVEYWVVKDTPCEMAMLDTGKTVVITKENRPAVMEAVKRNGRGVPMIRKTKRRSVCMYLITATDILAGPYELELSRIPVFRVPGWEQQVGARKMRWGLVRFAKDPLRLLNFWRSISAEMLAQSVQSGWLVHEEQEGNADQFREAHLNGDTVLTWKGQQKPERITPAQVNAAVLNEAAMCAQDLKDVTGLHDASLGVRSNETSGKAIMARQREGDVSAFIYHDNLHSAINECGRTCGDLLGVAYDTARTIRVLGEDEASKVVRINDPSDPESIDLLKGKYDYVIEVGPSYSTKRVEAAESMLAFIQAVPGAAQYAGDLIALAQDWPLAEKIGKRMRKAIPPQFLEGEEGEEEQQPDPMQMQQAQLAMAEKQAEIAERQAKAKQAEASAVAAIRNAETNAYKAETGRLQTMVGKDGVGVTLDNVRATLLQLAASMADGPDIAPGAAPQASGGGMPAPEQPAIGEGPPSP